MQLRARFIVELVATLGYHHCELGTLRKIGRLVNDDATVLDLSFQRLN
jgi:hypothetical protein